MLIFFKLLYSNLVSILIAENLIILILVIFFVYIQKFKDFLLVNKLLKKINLLYIFVFLVFIILIGHSMSLGEQQKFIYFQF
jgi:hypothetical protein